MIKIYNKATYESLGRVSAEEFKFLQDHLEDESITDRDYYITRESIDSFAEDGAPVRVVELLRNGMRSDKDIEIRWELETGLSSSSS